MPVISTSTSTAKQVTTAMTSDTTVSTGSYNEPFMRAKSIVVTSKGMKPDSNMWLFFNEHNVCHLFSPATELVIPAGITEFLDYDGSPKNNDHMLDGSRRTMLGNYDNLEYGEVITCAAGGTAVVLADETIMNPSTMLAERVLYVTNVIGTLTGTVTGSVTNAAALITTLRVPSDIKTNSLGNMYGVLHIPNKTFPAGSSTLVVSDSWTGDIANADSFGSAQYYTNGKINTFTRTQTFNTDTKTITTINSVVQNNVTVSAGAKVICTPNQVVAVPNNVGVGMEQFTYSKKCNSAGTAWSAIISTRRYYNCE